jgi:hypothetical protein
MHARIILGGLLAVWSVAGWADVPQRNLLVQWRVVSTAAQDTHATGLRQGEVVVDTRHGVSGSGVLAWSTTHSQRAQDVDGEVLVLNGARASLAVRRQQPVTRWQWVVQVPLSAQGQLPSSASRPQAGGGVGPSASLLSDTVWLDRGQGMSVRPRWSGGHAPVQVELDAEMDSPGNQSNFDPDGQAAGASARTLVRTTLGMALDEWTPVARTGGALQRQSSSAWHSETVRRDEQAELQIRVRLP